MTTAAIITYRLSRGNSLLGTLDHPVSGEVVAWHGGVFSPGAAFENVRPLFENELHLLTAGRMAEWREIWDEIQRPGLRLEPVSAGEPTPLVFIHIDADHAWWR